MVGCLKRTLGAVVVAAFVCLIAACSRQETVPDYILQLAADGESIERMEEYEGDGITAVYAVGAKGESPRMIAQESCVQGFNDTIKVLVLIDIPTGLTDGIHILEHHETDDYGGYVTEEWFLRRFAGQDIGTSLALVKMAAKSKEEIVAITGATYTSQAVVDAVNMCLINYRKIIEEVEL